MDNNLNNNTCDDFEKNYSDEEYEEALAKLYQSKSKRERSIIKENKNKKHSTSDKSNNKSFIERCKEDLVIPICLLCILLVVVGLILYMILPSMFTKTLDITVDELRNQYKTTQIYVDALQGFNFDIPEVEYVTKDEAVTAEETAETEENSDDYNYFKAEIANTATSFATGIQGSVKKSNNEIVSLRVLIEYSNDENFYSFMQIYFASYLQTVFPEMNKDEASTAVLNSLNSIENGISPFTVKNDKAYRTMIGKDGDIAYIALDIIPSDKVPVN
ncbi:MAG: hypothetical protein MJ153_03305 [Clostridia bacterium]|nr:hypothetical protein [Clostridia bacterium]